MFWIAKQIVEKGIFNRPPSVYPSISLENNAICLEVEGQQTRSGLIVLQPSDGGFSCQYI